MAWRAAGALSIVLLVSFAAATALNAAWQPNGTVVCGASGEQMGVAAVSDGAGGAIVAWMDTRSGSNLDVYAQRISAAGAVLWTSNGVAVCAAANDQIYPVIVSDGAGGAIIIWEDCRSGSADTYAQRISASGVAQWMANGVAICTAMYGQFFRAAVADGAGGAVITWTDFRSEIDIYAQRISSAGEVQWTANGVLVAGGSTTQNHPRIASDGAGGAIIAWDDELGGGNIDIYAQRISGGGAVLWDYEKGKPICSNSSAQVVPDLVSDGAGGAVIIWYDLRDGYATYYAQRVTPGGEVRWTANGVSLFTSSYNPGNERIITDGAGGAFVSLVGEPYIGSGLLVAQRIDSAGAVQWTGAGTVVQSGTVYWGQHGLVSDGTGGIFVVWTDTGSPESFDVLGQRVDEDGSLAWSAGGVGVCSAAQNQSDPCAVADGLGGMIVAWEDSRSMVANDIYAQKAWGNGAMGDPAPSITAVLDVPYDQGGRITLQWAASPLDVFPSAEITHYSVWRRLAGGAAGAPIEPDGKTIRFLAGASGYAWEWISNVPAKHYEEYAFMVESRYDSIGSVPGWQYFVVSAHTADPLVYFDSGVDSGYSVDNLSPAEPVGLLAEQRHAPEGLTLAWSKNAESDLSRYSVYRGLSEDFVPEPGNRIASPAAASCFDADWRWDSGYYYKVSAIDVHGNESEFALLRPEDVTGDETPAAPRASYLAQNYPNPFNPSTRITFGLAAPATVSLRIYDAAGRLVRVMVDGALPAGHYAESWNGLDDGGRHVANGVYFYRLDAGSFTQTKKMILVK